MFTRRQARAALATTAVFGTLHVVVGVLWTSLLFLGSDGSWNALPGWLLAVVSVSARAGIIAGVAFSLLLHRFERSQSVRRLSAVRVATWGVLAAIPAYSVVEGM